MQTRLVGGIQLSVDKVVRADLATYGHFYRETCAAIDAPTGACEDLIDSLHRQPDVLDALSLADGVAIRAHLGIGSQATEVEPRLHSPPLVEHVAHGQRPGGRLIVVGGTNNLVLAWLVGIVQGNLNHRGACGRRTFIGMIGQVGGIVTPVVDGC